MQATPWNFPKVNLTQALPVHAAMGLHSHSAMQAGELCARDLAKCGMENIYIYTPWNGIEGLIQSEGSSKWLFCHRFCRLVSLKIWKSCTFARSEDYANCSIVPHQSWPWLEIAMMAWYLVKARGFPHVHPKSQKQHETHRVSSQDWKSTQKPF